MQLPDERVELSRSGQPDLDFRMVGEPQQPAAWVGLGEPRRLLAEVRDAEVRAELGPGLRDVGISPSTGSRSANSLTGEIMTSCDQL